ATQARLQQGVLPVPERLTVGEWLPHWLEVAVKPPARRRNTYVGFEVRTRRDILPALGHHRLAQLPPPHAERWLRDLRTRRLAPRTIQYEHAVLRTALEHALRQGLVYRNVAKLVAGVRAPQDEVQPLEPETVNAVLTAAAGDRLEA